MGGGGILFSLKALLCFIHVLNYLISFFYLLGAVIVFTALLSVAFLGRIIKKHMWAGMFTVIIGLVLVGLADIVFGKKDKTSDTNGIIAGKYRGPYMWVHVLLN